MHVRQNAFSFAFALRTATAPAHVHVRVRVHAPILVNACVRTHSHAQAHAHTQNTHTHTHTHTHAHARILPHRHTQHGQQLRNYSALQIHVTRQPDLFCTKLCYHILNHIEPVNNSKLVPRRVCIHLLKPCLNNCLSGYLFVTHYTNWVPAFALGSSHRLLETHC